MTMQEAYDSVSLGDIVSSKVIYQYTIDCEWESADNRHSCSDAFVAKSPFPLSNAQVYEQASQAGYRYELGRVICGCHGGDEENSQLNFDDTKPAASGEEN